VPLGPDSPAQGEPGAAHFTDAADALRFPGQRRKRPFLPDSSSPGDFGGPRHEQDAERETNFQPGQKMYRNFPRRARYRGAAVFRKRILDLYSIQ
jgi:hypothetical protein